MRWVAFALAMVFCGCEGSPQPDLLVRVRTDLVPGVEFLGATVRVDEGPAAMALATLQQQDWLAGRRVWEIPLNASDEPVLLRVSLIDAAGAPVADKQVRVLHREAQSVTVVFARRCEAAVTDCIEEVPCDGSECIVDSCRSSSAGLCGARRCEATTDCGVTAGCAEPTCEGGFCLLRPTAESCTDGYYCNAELGCTELPPGLTSLDGSLDVGPDAGPVVPPSSIPSISWPVFGTPIGSVHAPDTLVNGGRRPVLASSAASDSVHVQFASMCDGPTINCPFEERLVHAGHADRFEFGSQLYALRETVFATEATAPVGRRLRYRMASCNEGGCSEYSEPRWLALGRLRFDFNGDGFDELCVGDPGGQRVLIWRGTEDGPGEMEILEPPEDSSGFGRAFGAGDFDGDGFADLVVGAPTDGAGRVWLFAGGTSGLEFATAIAADAATSEFGRDVSWLGDADLDGYTDLFIAGAGASAVRFGAADAPLGESLVLPAGLRGGLVGDVHANGRTSFWIHSDSETREYQIMAGRAGVEAGFLWDAEMLAPLGPEAVVGADSRDTSLLSILYRFGSPSVVRREYDDLPGLGASLAVADFDSDGRTDTLAGAGDADADAAAGAGLILALYGAIPLAPAGDRLRAADPRAGEAAGTMTSSGDFNGDGYADALVSASERVLIFFGSAAGVGLRPDAAIEVDNTMGLVLGR